MASEKRMYEIYTANCLYYINKRLGFTLRKQYSEMLFPKKEDTRSPQEVFDEIKTRFGLKVVND